MSWKVVIPGQPPTINHAYKVTTKYRRTKSGAKVPYAAIVKDEIASAYQQAASIVVASGRPSRWEWGGGYLRLMYRFYLSRDADCDNLLKILNDAIASTLDINDKWFLPMVMNKKVVSSADPRVEVTVVQEGDDEWRSFESIATRPDEMP